MTLIRLITYIIIVILYIVINNINKSIDKRVLSVKPVTDQSKRENMQTIYISNAVIALIKPNYSFVLIHTRVFDLYPLTQYSRK